MYYRVKCNCGNVQDLNVDGVCTKCNSALSIANEAAIQVYRMGSPLGVAVGFGIYIDDVPYGHLANQQSIIIPVKAGTHKLHMTHGMNRRCKDLEVTVNPGEVKYAKAKLKAGFWTNTVVIMDATEADMPKN